MNDVIIDRELKILILKGLKKGYFSTDELNVLRPKIGTQIVLEVIDNCMPIFHSEEEVDAFEPIWQEYQAKCREFNVSPYREFQETELI